MQKTLNATEVSKHLGVTVKTFYNMIKDGRFPVRSIKGLTPRRWNLEEIEQWRNTTDDSGSV